MTNKKEIPSNSPEDLISENELIFLAEKVFSRYVNIGLVSQIEKEHFISTMVQNFIQRINQIFESYSGNSKLSTYCIVVLNRICNENIKTQRGSRNKKKIKHIQ
jgi:hypothetical protein